VVRFVRVGHDFIRLFRGKSYYRIGEKREKKKLNIIYPKIGRKKRWGGIFFVLFYKCFFAGMGLE